MTPLPILLAIACADTPTSGSDTTAPAVDTAPGSDADADTDVDADTDTDTDTVDHCAEVEAFGPVFADTVAQWVLQDMLDPWPADGLVFVGSSSIRRWEELARSYADYGPIQRGFGGAQAGEVALFAHDLVVRHAPRAVVVFAGTNDVAASVSAEIVSERVACLRQRVPDDIPMLFIGITPTPSRWSQWGTASAVNDAVAELASDDPSLVYVDVPAAFLKTGSPPDTSLFVSDALHLSESGYALWDSVLRPAVEAALDPLPPASGGGFSTGAEIRVDFGPSNAEDGIVSEGTDSFGQRWNSWHARDGGASVLPGEHLDDLITSAGAETDIDLVITGGFYVNGLRNGGLQSPSTDRLGNFAVASATADFFYGLPDDATGGFFLRGLDPARTYTLRFFAARDSSEQRVTAYTVSGATESTVSLQTSGSGAGSTGQTNDDTVAELTGLQPDRWGHLFVDVSIDTGSYSYLSAMALVAE